MTQIALKMLLIPSIIFMMLIPAGITLANSSGSPHTIEPTDVRFKVCGLPPTYGEWVISQSCTLSNYALIRNGNLIVQNNSVFTIINVTMYVDLVDYNITIESGSGILLSPDARLRNFH